MADSLTPRDDVKARRMEARRRRAQREGLDTDAGEAATPNLPVPAEPMASIPATVPTPVADNLVEFSRRKNRKNNTAALVDDDEEHARALPVPQVGDSRLIARLNEMRGGVAVGHAGPVTKARRGKGRILASFILLVLMPCIAVTAYMYFVASNQYATDIRFAVRNAQVPTALGSNSPVGNPMSALPDLADSYVVVEYLESREFVEDLHKSVNLHSIYSVPDADWWYRMPEGISIEKMTHYMSDMITVTFDMYTGITTVKVRAFTPENAKKVGDSTLGMVEALVNRITVGARRDLVRDAELDVQRAENRLRLARAAITKFRSEEQAVDPSAVAAAQTANIAKLESDLTSLKSELNQLNQTMSPNSPRVRVQQSKVDALEKQIDDEKTKVAVKTRAGAAMAAQLARFEELTVERDFAQAAYVSAQSALELARGQAERNQRFLAMIVSPRQAQASQYPQRARYSILMSLAIFGLWAVATLVFGSIRDHM